MLKKIFLKIIIMGDSGVGKSSLLNSYVNRSFVGKYKATIGADFMSKEFNLDGHSIVMQIWDTAGQERFNSLSTAFFRGADGCMLVFDINNSNSFDNLDKWYKECLTQITPFEPELFPIILIGNKIDMKNYTFVTTKQANSWCFINGNINYIETSAKTSYNIDKAFYLMAKKCLSLNKDITSYQTESIHVYSEKKKHCCTIS